jgi:hypothetical protein
MSSETVVFRFPPEPSEYRLSDKKPNPGDVLSRNGDRWVVVSVDEHKDGATVVTLRPGDKPA